MLQVEVDKSIRDITAKKQVKKNDLKLVSSNFLDGYAN